MPNSTLHLTVDKGPKQGETLARDPGAVIRIGRVVRGNNFPIKDPGISQKHLAIEFAGAISRWTVADLDTSNGTIVNGYNIHSSTPFPLSDGDTIKIGESTSISVRIDGGGEIGGGLRRGRSRGARSRAGSLEPVVEEENQDRGEEPNNLGTGRRKNEILDTVGEDSVGVRATRARTRAASARIQKDDDNVEVNPKKSEPLGSVVEDSIEVPKNARRGRPKRAPARTHASVAKVMQADDDVVQADSVADGVIKNEEANVESNVAVDLERVTLGDWFDSMEKYLPQAINEVALQMIASLREKARRFDEYMVNASNDG